jgi:hypothetical protein
MRVSKKAGRTGKREAEVMVEAARKEEASVAEGEDGGQEAGKKREARKSRKAGRGARNRGRKDPTLAETFKHSLIDEQSESERILPGHRACEFVTLRSVSGAVEIPTRLPLGVCRLSPAVLFQMLSRSDRRTRTDSRFVTGRT